MHFWSNLTPIINFLGQNDYSILKTIFGLTFNSILENLLESFFRKVPKTVILAIFWHVWPKSAKMRIFSKNRAMLFFTLIVPQLQAEFQKKSLERFPRSIRYGRTHTRTHKSDITEPVAFAGSISMGLS